MKMRPVVEAVDRVDRTITAVLSPLGIVTLGFFSLYYVALSYGFVVVALAGGRDGFSRVVATSGYPTLVLVGVPMIPVLLISLEAIDVESRILTYWRSKVSPKLSSVPVIGRVVEYVWPTPTRQPYLSRPTGFNSVLDYVSRSVSGGLLLPIIAYIIGMRHLSQEENSSELYWLVFVVCI